MQNGYSYPKLCSMHWEPNGWWDWHTSYQHVFLDRTFSYSETAKLSLEDSFIFPQCTFGNSLSFSMIQRILAIWSLVPLPFLKPAWTSGSSQFMYCWSLAWRILSINLFLLYWLCQSLGLCGSQQTLENSERDGNTRPPDLPLEKSVCRSGSNS